MTPQEESTSSNHPVAESARRRRWLYAAAAGFVAVAALAIIMTRPTGSDANAGQNTAAEDNAVATESVATLQTYSAALPSCCYPPPTAAPDAPEAAR